jgi:hypothetical protein
VPTFKIVNERGAVIAETDDWVEAETRASAENWPEGFGHRLGIRGTHPTHDWDRQAVLRRCRNCGGWDNGSYGSHAPCGYDWQGSSLAAALEREIAAREVKRS